MSETPKKQTWTVTMDVTTTHREEVEAASESEAEDLAVAEMVNRGYSKYDVSVASVEPAEPA